MQVLVEPTQARGTYTGQILELPAPFAIKVIHFGTESVDNDDDDTGDRTCDESVLNGGGSRSIVKERRQLVRQMA